MRSQSLCSVEGVAAAREGRQIVQEAEVVVEEEDHC